MFSEIDARLMGAEFANRLHAAGSPEARGGVLDAFSGVKSVIEARTGGYRLTSVISRAFNERMDELEPLSLGHQRRKLFGGES
jgi:hypothetical protein